MLVNSVKVGFQFFMSLYFWFNLFSWTSRQNLGMVIDLTKTSRYYNKEEFETKGVQYVKLPCEGSHFFNFFLFFLEISSEPPLHFAGMKMCHPQNEWPSFDRL